MFPLFVLTDFAKAKEDEHTIEPRVQSGFPDLSSLPDRAKIKGIGYESDKKMRYHIVGQQSPLAQVSNAVVRIYRTPVSQEM